MKDLRLLRDFSDQGTSHKTQDLQELQANKVVIVTRDLKRSVRDMKTMDVDAS